MRPIIKIAAIFMTSFFLFSAFAKAEITSINVTSFIPAGNRQVTGAAELCGNVQSNKLQAVRVDVVIDNHRIYTTLPSRNGSFCVVVYTEAGRAQVYGYEVDAKDGISILPVRAMVEAQLSEAYTLPIEQPKTN